MGVASAQTPNETVIPMNPLKQAAALVGKPIEIVSDIVNRPGANPTPHALGRAIGRRRSLAESVKGRNVLITGGSSGIGAAAALQIGAAGGTVILVARGEEKLNATAEQVRKAGGTFASRGYSSRGDPRWRRRRARRERASAATV